MNPKLNFLIGSGLAGVVVAVLVFAPPALKDSTAAAVPPQLAQGFSSIVKAVTPAVVNIQVTQGERVRGPRDPRRRDHEGPPGRPGPGPFGGPPPGPFSGPGPFGEPPGEQEEPEPGVPFGGPPRPDMSGGSGVIIDPNGYIVTNNHVVDRASDIKVYLSNKKEHAAKIIGVDPKTELAIIKVEATNLPYLQWGNDGIGFAVPVSLAKPVAESLIKIGKVVRGWLGVAIQEITPDLAKAFKVREQKGALVSDVNEQGPALKAGLQRGDVIVEFNGKEVQTVSELRNRVAQTPVGSKVSVKVIRDGQEKLLTIQIGERPSDAMLARGIEPGSAAPEAGEVRKAPLNVLSDLRVRAIDEETRSQLNIGPKTAGVVVAHVQAGSAAEQAGLQRGDVIQEINRQAITGMKDFEAAAAKIKKDENAVLLVSRQGNSLFIVINP